jgi:hypothetical protein
MSVAPILSKDVKEAAKKADQGKPTHFLRGPKTARPTSDELLGVPYEAPMIVAGYLPQDAGGDVAPGGTGKSTLLIYEAVHIILGRPLYGRQIVRPGAALFITAEDKREVVLGRLNQICRALELTKKEYEKVRNSFYVEDVSACPAKLVEADRYGAQPTSFVDEIVAKYKGAKLAVAILDPTSLLGPGEMSGNDGMAELMRTSRMLSQQLEAAVRLVHHVAQAVARGKIRDQYAGRGGTAFADNSRGQRQVIVLMERKFEHEGSAYELPAQISEEDLARSRVLAIFVHKLSYSERDSTPIILIRRSFAYQFVPIERLDKSPLAEAARRDEEMNRTTDFIAKQCAAGVHIGKRELDGHATQLGMTRDDLRERVATAMKLGLLVELPLPANERRTKRTKYLAPFVSKSNPANPAKSGETGSPDSGHPKVPAAANPAADGTSIGRRIRNAQKRGRGAGTAEGNPAESGEDRRPAKKRLNGQVVDHA